MKESFNVNHPELRDGEMFIANADEKELCEIKWKTKRTGDCAYNRDGVTIPKTSGVKPVFITKKEFHRFGGQ